MKKAIHLSSTVPNHCDGKRLDQVLAILFADYSRSQLQEWIQAGYVHVNQQPITRTRTKVHGEDAIDIHAQLTPKENWEAQPIPLNIVHEDDDLLIINKPAGLVVHPGAGNPDNTLINALLHYQPLLANIPRAGIVHRLDKDTTGLLMVAKTLTAHHALVDALAKRTIKREYQAIVRGVMIAGGTVDAPIGRHARQRQQMAVKEIGGKPAVTHYRIIKRFRAHTHIRCELDTGRTHQIRVHMAYINHPIVGDPLYSKHQRALISFPRQALHAFRLSLQHPQTQEIVSYEAPLPDDMLNLIALLEQDETNER